MNPVHSMIILLAALVAVFAEAAVGGIRHLIGVQIDWLPALMVYAALFSGTTTVVLLALLGGLGFDSLSANPLGVSVLPLFAIGFLIVLKRELILREEPFAQVVLVLIASATAPVLTLLLLLTMGRAPLVGWGSLWQWVVMSLAAALASPILFYVLNWFDRALVYRRATEITFRPDREIRRGR
jgi:rod shape-determining protein MreD